jgi:hypothetical protein
MQSLTSNLNWTACMNASCESSAFTVHGLTTSFLPIEYVDHPPRNASRRTPAAGRQAWESVLRRVQSPGLG